MIVTFHIAVYLVYYVWNNYISHHISDNQSMQNNSSSSQSGNINQTNPTNGVDSNEAPDEQTNGEKSSPDQSMQNPNVSSGDVDPNNQSQKSIQVKEGGGDFHPCLPQMLSDYEDKGTDESNEIEPEYINLTECQSKLNNIGNRNQSNPTANGVDINVASTEPTNKEPNSAPDCPRFNQSNLNQNTSSDVDPNTQPLNCTRTKEREGDFHPCLPQILSDEEDKGRDIIYNVEPEYGCICTEKKVQFFPPVYIQRYMEIERILKEPHWAKAVKKVVDFGCAELSFETKYLKRLFGIEEIVAVDIDSELLENNCCKVSPFPSDYLKKRPTPLSVRVFRGSVAHTHDSLTGADAVIAIELIEHLFPPELECLPFTIFGFIKPKIAIFTTPNSDFNVLFTGLSGFRHPDHKFEWSQQQFEDWADNLVQQYPDYQVVYKGIGPGPSGSEKYGCCSQMATFTKVDETNPISDEEKHVQDGPYTLIAETVFPYFKDERTEEEKIRDAAECFINNCKMRSRICDELESDIPIKSVMGRIKYYDKEKLKEILIARNWEVKMNSSGEEVVVFPDSEEEEDSEPETNEYIIENIESLDSVNAKNSPEIEENWDYVEGVDTDMTLTGSQHDLCIDQVCPGRTSDGDGACVSDKSYHSVETVNTKAKFLDSTNTDRFVSSDKLNFSPSEKCSIPETTVPDIELSDKLSYSHIDSVPEKDTNLNFERSIYETPYNNDFNNHLKSDCDVCDCSLPVSDQAVKGCKRALIMESPKELAQFEVNPQSEDPLCLSTVSSSCDTSIYTTPCCSQRHRNNIPKCLSLQQISTCCGSPAFSTELETTLKEGKLVKNQTDQFSKSVEGFKSLENDLTCSSTSKVVDSGYPDSYSEYNMDMDLTPEQFDDIETESEENDVSSRSLSPPPPPPQIPWLIDDVQNGDVANNNRDGEGNNLVADMEEEPLEFEARIDEINNEVLNLAPANDAIDFDHDMKSGEPFEGICGDCLTYISDPPSMSDLTNGHQRMSEKSPNHDLLKPESVFTEKSTEMVSSDSLDKRSLRSTKSDTSIATNHSCGLDPREGQMSCKSEGVSYHRKIQTPKIKTHNSLTTVLDGCSKFSNCSLVRPVEVYQVTGLENNSPSALSKSTPNGSREPVQQERTSDVHATASLTSTGLQDDRQSLVSVYQSAESLNNTRELQPEYHNDQLPDTSSFPDWLLKILVSDTDENEVGSLDSVESVWDSDSLEERMELNYDVQVDARGGGDPQRDTWH